MKSLVIIAVVLLAVIVYRLSEQPTPVVSNTVVPTPRPAEHDETVPPGIAKLAKRTGTSAAQVEAVLRPVRFEGSISQHVGHGYLLVRGYFVEKGRMRVLEDFALWGYPDADLLADGASISCNVAVVGVYDYPTISGANRAIYELLDMDSLPKRNARDVAPSTPLESPRLIPLDTPPRPTPDPRAVAREIERKYGKPKP